MPFVACIVGYSFSTQAQTFAVFLECFKEGVSGLYDKLIAADFHILLHALSEATRLRAERYFPDLNGHTMTLRCAFELIKQKKVQAFNCETVRLLISQDADALQIIHSRPTV